MWLDLRLAIRNLWRSPTFATTAVLTLAIGIGGSAAIFSLVDAVLLRPLPYRDPDRLVRVWEANLAQGKEHFFVSPGTFKDWRQGAHSFDDLALFSAIDDSPTVVATGDGAVQTHEASVTTNLFDLVGVRPVLGRGFERFSQNPEDTSEIVVGHSLWQRAFGGDPTIVGRLLSIEGRARYIVVGVMPPGFSFPGKTELWSPTKVDRVGAAYRATRFYGVVGRLKPGSTIDAARAELSTISGQLAVEYPSINRGWTATIEPLQDSIVGGTGAPLLMLFGAVTLVLLVGCANVSNLLLARSVSRTRELAVRAALGATRVRIARLLLADALAIAAAGGTAGWLVAAALVPAAARVGASIPRIADAHLNLKTFLFCAAVSLLTTLIVGLSPALRAVRADFSVAMQGDGERATAHRGDRRTHQAFLVAQIAACMILVVAATLLVRAFVRLRAVELGFNPRHVVAIDVRVPIFKFGNMAAPGRLRLMDETQQMLARLRGTPGIEAVATASDVPLGGSVLTTQMTLWTQTGARANSAMVFYHRVSPTYFSTIGMSLIAGRNFDDRDAFQAAQVTERGMVGTRRDGAAIVSEATARKFWPDGNAIGQFISTDMDWTVGRREIVGIVRNVRSETLQKAPPLEIYAPFLEDPSFALTLLVRTPLPLPAIAPRLRGELRDIDRDVSVGTVRMLDDVVTESIGSTRFSAPIITTFAGLGLLMAAVGVYGVLAFGIARRRREIGIRMALGAQSSDISRMVLQQSMRAVAAGIAVGAVGAFAAGRLMSGVLFGVAPSDPVSFGTAIATLLVVALLASYVPVRHAIRVDPADALRDI